MTFRWCHTYNAEPTSDNPATRELLLATVVAMTIGLGTITDLAIAREGGAAIENHPGYIAISTPDNPGFYWGNFLQILDDATDPLPWIARFEQHFPAAVHRTFGLPTGTDLTAWAALGYHSDTEETLVAAQVPAQTSCPDGYRCGPITEWEHYIQFELADNRRTGAHDAATYEDYLRSRVGGYQRLVAKGIAEFFGATSTCGELAATLGIVVCPPLEVGSTIMRDIARYQHVVTHPEHRCKGLASHLLGLAGQWASDQGATSFVICTETTNPAGRIYRKAGFEPHALGLGAEKYPSSDTATD